MFCNTNIKISMNIYKYYNHSCSLAEIKDMHLEKFILVIHINFYNFEYRTKFRNIIFLRVCTLNSLMGMENTLNLTISNLKNHISLSQK